MEETIYYIDGLTTYTDCSLDNYDVSSFDYFIYTYEKDGEIKHDYTDSLWK